MEAFRKILDSYGLYDTEHHFPGFKLPMFGRARSSTKWGKAGALVVEWPSNERSSAIKHDQFEAYNANPARRPL